MKTITCGFTLIGLAIASGCSEPVKLSGQTQPKTEEHLISANPEEFEYFQSTVEKIAVGFQYPNVDELVRKDVRTPLMRFEAVLRIYSAAYGGIFTTHLALIKRMEDAIGQYRDEGAMYEYARAQGASQEILDRLLASRDAWKKTLLDLLQFDQWVGPNPITSQMKKAHAEYAWPTLREGRKNILKTVVREMERIRDFPYNMNVLEVGGVHAFRIQLRWLVPHQFRELNFYLEQNNTSICPISSPLPSGKSYDFVASGSTPTCKIAPCLVNSITYLVAKFGELKQRGQEITATGGIPTEVFAAANVEYLKFKSSGLMEAWIDTLNACAQGESL